jgi:cyclophilin family peptidyl-prolyl cis-trans isomerase
MSRSWNNWLARWKNALGGSRRPIRRRPAPFRLQAEMLETRVTPAVTYGTIIGQGPPRDTVAPKVTIDFVTSPTAKNQTITGRVTDNFPISGDTLLMRVDNGAPQSLRLGPAGQFQFATGFKTDGSADGNHTFVFVARDKAGNNSAFARTTVNLNTTAGALTVKLDPASDDGTAGDNKTTQATVKLTGTGPKSATITLTLPGGTTTTTQSDANGAYAFSNVALTSGPNAFKVTATGTNSQHLTANLTIIRDNAPTVAQAISNFSVPANSAKSVFNLPTVFSDQDVNALVEFTTNRGTIDVELFNQQVGTTVANFLKYVTGAIASHQSYNDTIFHRVTNLTTDGIGVLQGGGYLLGSNASGTTLTHITGDAAIALQDLLSNARGTIAMARTSAPNSATSEFFFNATDNKSLDHGGQGANSNGYAVFGVVRGNGMSVVDASAAIPPVNEGGAFASLPITGATPNDPNFPTDTTASQYERITGVSVLRQPNAAAPDSLTFTATSSNTSLVTTTIVNGELTLTYASGQTGSSTISLTATDSAGISVTSTFTVAVGDHAPPAVTITSPTGDVSVNANPTITGTATDDTGVTKLVASVDGGAAQTVAVDSQGHFSFTPNLPTNGSADGAHTVTFTATDAAGNNSTPASATFHLDSTAPVVAISAPTDNQTFGNNPTITGTATDNQTLTGLTASVDGGAAQNVTVDGTGHWSFTTGLATNGSADGTHTVTFIGTDAAGNTSNHATLTFVLNTTTHASVTLTAPAAGQSFQTNPAFTGSVTDSGEAGQLTASVDGGAAVAVTVDAQGNFTFTPTVTTDGTHTVTFSAPGHVDVSRAYTLDATAPVVTITSPADGQTFNFDPTLKGTIVDATSGVASVTVNVDGTQSRILDLDSQGNFTYIPPVASGGAADGPHTVTITATDNVGNVTTQTFTFTLDTVAPGIQVTEPGDGASLKTSPDFAGTVADAGGVASLKVSVDGGADQTITVDAQGNFTFNPGLPTDGTADGPHQYAFTAVDNAGNVSHVTETVYLDTTKPVATVTGPASGQTFTDNVTITGSATDNIGTGFVNVYVDGTFVTGFGFPTNGSFSYTTTLPTDGTANGPHTVSFVAVDSAGNASDPADFTFTLASPGAAVHLTAPTEGQALNAVPAFTGSVASLSEAGNLTASVDGGAAQTVTVDAQGNFSFTPSVTGDGTHSVTFAANAPYTSVTRSFVLDTAAPSLNVTSPANGQTFKASPTITGTASDATSGVASAQASVDDGPPVDVTVDAQGNFSFTPNLATDGSADGPHTVSITVTDRAGNVSTAAVVTFTLDTVVPTVTLNGPADQASQSSSPMFFGQASDANGLSSLTVAVDGGAAQTLAHDPQGNFSFDPNLPTDGSADGPHTYVFSATDAAGNVTTISRTVYLDTTKPVAMITSPADNSVQTTNPTIQGSATDNVGTGFVNVYVDGVFVTGFAFPTNGSFSYTTNFATDGTANGPHTVTFIVTDAAGNQSDPVTLHFTLVAP